ncbi:MAG: hypothetical protein IPK19_13075 [Chloroflexi bacterium]|nr:hypothetical protein [Chloroflexota bacterium]
MVFDAARQYWDRFRPTVISNFDFLSYVAQPRGHRHRHHDARLWRPRRRRSGARAAPRLVSTPSCDTLRATKQVLDQRAMLAQPFGVPIREATLTPARSTSPSDAHFHPEFRLHHCRRRPPSPPRAIRPLPAPAPVEPTPGSIGGVGR